MKTHRDPGGPIGEIESALFDSLAETTLAARHLALRCRANQTLALMLSAAHGKEESRLLVALMAAEHGHRKRARKGTNARQHGR